MSLLEDPIYKAYLNTVAPKPQVFTLWDVGHGLSIWIKTPKGQNHWIDAGWYPDTGFMSDADVKSVAGFETTLRKLSADEYISLFRHGYEVCSAVLHGINRISFSEFKQANYPWIT